MLFSRPLAAAFNSVVICSVGVQAKHLYFVARHRRKDSIFLGVICIIVWITPSMGCSIPVKLGSAGYVRLPFYICRRTGNILAPDSAQGGVPVRVYGRLLWRCCVPTALFSAYCGFDDSASASFASIRANGISPSFSHMMCRSSAFSTSERGTSTCFPLNSTGWLSCTVSSSIST